ncbi:MAG: hypothetical protein ACQEQ7_11010 [Thermodesulfobacteriota bacterium]
MMKYGNLGYRLVVYVAAAGLIAAVAGCSQGPVSDEEAEELRDKIKDIRTEMTQMKNKLADVAQEIDDSDIEQELKGIHDKLDSMTKTASDVDEKLKPEEPPKPAPAGGGAGGGAPGGRPGGGAGGRGY